MRSLSENEIQAVSGGTYPLFWSLATSVVGGILSGVVHRDWRISVTVDGLINAAVAYYVAPAAVVSTVTAGAVLHMMAYVGTDYLAPPLPNP